MLSNIFISSVSNNYILYFDGHTECKHSKKIINLADYKFIFCKSSKDLIAVYCPTIIKTDEDVLTVLDSLTDTSFLLGSVSQVNDYMNRIATTLMSTKKIFFV